MHGPPSSVGRARKALNLVVVASSLVGVVELQ